MASSDASEGNLLSGNTFAGVLITGQGTEGNAVAGNFIGTTVSGDTALPNGENAYSNYWGYRHPASGGGVMIAGSAYGNLIDANVISGNYNLGVELSGNGTSGNVVQGNMIGTDLTGTLDLGNSSGGIEVDTGASDNTIGGTNAGAGNLITNNDGPGVIVGNSVNDTTVGDQITSNSIFGNQGPAIDLGNAGVISNSSSPQQGPNNLQNFPIIVTAADGSLEGWLGGSTPDTTFRIDVFASGAYGPGGAGEAQDYLGSLNVTTDATGQVTFAVPFAAPASLPIVTATATDPLGNTSELSAVRQDTLQAPTQALLLVPGGPLIVSTALGNGIVLLDPDAGPFDPEWNLALSVPLGTLTLASTAGLTGSGDGTGSLSYSGALSALNAALDGLEFTPPPGLNTTTLSLNAASEGASPLQGQLLITDGIFSVTTTADSGPGSLRQAILDSNAGTTGSTNTIDFDIPGQGVQTITPASPLPTITNPVLIDGTSQPGYDGTPLIELSGSQAGTSAGLVITGPDVTVRGIDINEFVAGIYITGTSATGDWIYDNFLGTDPTGTQALPNAYGVGIGGGASNNLVGANGDGASDTSERNLISGNTYAGVWIDGSDGDAVAGNLIGTTVTGDTALPNGEGPEEYYGTLYPGSGGGVVVSLYNANSYSNYGDLVSDNVISGNNNIGVELSGNGTSGNVVQGNVIGTDLTGTLDLGNSSGGIEVDTGASDNTIGGTSAIAGNLITNNGGPGVVVGNSLTDTTVGDQITSNIIFGNQGPAIDLGDAGVLYNASSPQQGPNNLQNFPIIVTTADGSLQGWLGGSTPDTTFRIDVFASADYGPGGAGEAQDYLGSLDVTTDATGQVTFAVPFAAPASLPIVTATATDPLGNTSELSAIRRDTLQAPTQPLLMVPGGPLIFSTALGDDVELLDPDAGPFDPEWNLALSVPVGTLTLASTAGLTGSGDGTGSLSYSGALSALNAALDGMEFTPPTGFHGNTTPSLSASSEGASPLQGQLLITDGLFFVTTTADSGPGSLRQAILDSDAAATGSTNTIDFDIPGQGVQTIAPASPLPTITNPVLIDGFSQPGYDGTPLIELDGSQAGTGDGLTISGPDVTVRGLDINNFSQGAGIHITGTAANGDWIYGNFLGTDPTGTQAAPNAFGVGIDDGASNDLVGTNGDGASDTSERNLISGNTYTGVAILDSDGNTVAGNLIGATVSGDTALPDGKKPSYHYGYFYPGIAGGVEIYSAYGYAYGNLVSDNVISGNNNFGVELSGSGTIGNVVQGNLIGTDLTGTLDLGNSSGGIEVDTGASDNTIGGTSAGAGNLITNNGGPGVLVGYSESDATVGDQITSNSIFGNQGQAIDLGNDGVTYNASSPQQGPNNLQNFPIIVTAADGSLQGWLGGSTPDTTFRIDVLASALYSPGGAGEAQDYLGSLDVTTDATGQATFAVPFTAPAGLPIITATATDELGNTSEVSAVRRDTLQAPTQLLRVLPAGRLVFSTASGNGIELLDPDAGPLDAEWNLALSVSVGTLTLATTAGLTGSGDGTGSLSYSGPLPAINAALEGLVYTSPPPGSQGFATLSLSATSEGASPLQTQLNITDGFFSVTTTGDSGPGSLRQAILDSNVTTTSGTNTIDFDIPGPGVETIDLASPLPPITTSVLIDGTTQPGFAGTPLVAFSDQSPGSPGPISISGGDVTISGLAIDSVMIDATSAGFLIADLHSQGQSNQLSLLNTPGQVVVHSDGLSPADTDAAIAEHLVGGDYSLDGGSTGGPGSAIWTILLTPTSAPFQAIAVGADPSAIVAGDFTGDGHLDLAVANSGDDTVSVLLANGDGTFGPPVTYAVGSGPRCDCGG